MKIDEIFDHFWSFSHASMWKWSKWWLFCVLFFDHFWSANFMILMKFDDFDEKWCADDFCVLTVGLMLKWPLFCPKMGRFLRSCFLINTQPKMTKIGHFWPKNEDFFTFKSTLKMEKRLQLHFLALIGKNGGLAKYVCNTN